jgi:hypothetical protein
MYMQATLHPLMGCMQALNIFEHSPRMLNKIESAKSKITIPVLVLGGDIYPALGGDSQGTWD